MNQLNEINRVLMEQEFKDKTPIEILLHIFRENKKAKEKENEK